MYSALDITGLVLGILGLSGTIILVRSLLPKHRVVSLERSYAATYSLYQCSVSEGLLLPREQKDLREKLRSVRADLNDVKNNITCLGGTWRKIISTLIDIYRDLGVIDGTIHSIGIQIASTSRKGRERLEKNGIPYEPCMFPLAVTVSNSLESFRTNDASEIYQLFPSQEEPPRCSTLVVSSQAEFRPSHSDQGPPAGAAPYPSRAPQHRDSVSSTTTTIVNGSPCHSKSDLVEDAATNQRNRDEPVKDVTTASLAPRSFLLPLSLPKGVDPGLALGDYCMDLQLRVDILQSVLSHRQTFELSSTREADYTVDLEKCKEDLMAVLGRLSKVSGVWSRRETRPILPV